MVREQYTDARIPTNHKEENYIKKISPRHSILGYGKTKTEKNLKSNRGE